jgi:CRISPR-associated protein Csh2
MSKMGIVKNRSEIIFLYDVKDANPNGDPLDENKPRIDEETGINIVTDVRLKRTIRDYLYDFKDQEIFVREIELEDGTIQDAKTRARDFVNITEGMKEDEKKVVDAFKKGGKISRTDVPLIKRSISSNLRKDAIDVRLFGATVPLEFAKNEIIEKVTNPIKSSVTFTGPVQFKIGRSMHRVYMKHFRGTGAFASQKGATQKTFREEDFLPYSLINFYGIINENAAKTTKLTDEDVQLLLDGIWNGTKNLISRSKAGQIPRLLIKVNYSETNYHIGDLNNLITLVSGIPDEEIRDINQVKIDVTELMDTLKQNKGKISNIDFAIDGRVKLLCNGEEKSLEDCLSDMGIESNKLSF